MPGSEGVLMPKEKEVTITRQDMVRTPMLKNALRALPDLYEKTGTDWDLECTVCLTEPVYPAVRLIADSKDQPQFLAIADTLEEAIVKVLDQARKHFNE